MGDTYIQPSDRERSRPILTKDGLLPKIGRGLFCSKPGRIACDPISLCLIGRSQPRDTRYELDRLALLNPADAAAGSSRRLI